jgi:hypothetical protein
MKIETAELVFIVIPTVVGSLYIAYRLLEYFL